MKGSVWRNVGVGPSLLTLQFKRLHMAV